MSYMDLVSLTRTERKRKACETGHGRTHSVVEMRTGMIIQFGNTNANTEDFAGTFVPNSFLGLQYPVFVQHVTN
jgi:hypothetical protein